MARVTINDSTMQGIAGAIRTKLSSSDTYKPSEMASAISSIPGGITPSGKVNITSTAETDVTSYATAQVVDADLVAGNIKKDVNILGVIGTYEGGGGSSSGVQVCLAQTDYRSSTLGATDLTLTVAETGTYTVSWTGCRNTSSGTSGTQLYIGSTAYGSENTTFSSSYWQRVNLTGVSLTAGQTITVYAQARSSSYHMYVSNLIIQKTS